MTQAVQEMPMTEPDEDRELIKRFGTSDRRAKVRGVEERGTGHPLAKGS